MYCHAGPHVRQSTSTPKLSRRKQSKCILFNSPSCLIFMLSPALTLASPLCHWASTSSWETSQTNVALSFSVTSTSCSCLTILISLAARIQIQTFIQVQNAWVQPWLNGPLRIRSSLPWTVSLAEVLSSVVLHIYWPWSSYAHLWMIRVRLLAWEWMPHFFPGFSSSSSWLRNNGSYIKMFCMLSICDYTIYF